MNRVVLRGSEIDSIEALHDLLRRELHLPEYYGGNLDALWDCLTGCIPMPLTIEWVDFAQCRRNIGEYADKVLSLFEDATKEVDGFMYVLR
jgi:ribonuclease inhibitor